MILCTGGTGQLSARIIQELLRNGFKVTAGMISSPASCVSTTNSTFRLLNLADSTGVQDAAEAQAGLDFAKRFEILKGDEIKRIRLQEVDLSDESSIAAALPRYNLSSRTHYTPTAQLIAATCMAITAWP